MSGKMRSKIFCICAIVTILGSSLFAITPYSKDYWNNIVEGEKPEQNTTPSLDDLWSPNSVTDSSIDDSFIIDKELNDNESPCCRAKKAKRSTASRSQKLQNL